MELHTAMVLFFYVFCMLLGLYFLTIGFGFKHRELINDEPKEKEINNTEVEEIENIEE